MFPHSVCNLPATLAKPPWTKPLNWNLHMTCDGEERIPFHLYVQSGAIQPSFQFENSFPQFDKLPSELQLRILTFCSASTLFQVMRVSSSLRIEAAKLFWADSNTYYLIESYWLLDGGLPGDTCYDLPFLAYVQNVEVEYEHGSDDKIGPLRDGAMDIQNDVVVNFWKALKERCPSVRRAVINQSWESLPPRKQNKPASRCLQVLTECCPPEIEVSAFVLEEQNSVINNSTTVSSANKWQRSFYHPRTDGEWKKLELSWDRKTILMPMKRFRGPVGEFEEFKYVANRMQLKQNALGPLVIEALDRHHFDMGRLEPFSCPEPGCDAHFRKAGQWTMHAAEAHMNEFIAWPQLNILPDKLRSVFEAYKSDLQRTGEEIGRKSKRMYDEWNEEGGEKRREMESGWVHQLENDEAWDTGQEARDSKLWKEFSMVMDPTWCGQ